MNQSHDNMRRSTQNPSFHVPTLASPYEVSKHANHGSPLCSAPRLSSHIAAVDFRTSELSCGARPRDPAILQHCSTKTAPYGPQKRGLVVLSPVLTKRSYFGRTQQNLPLLLGARTLLGAPILTRSDRTLVVAEDRTSSDPLRSPLRSARMDGRCAFCRPLQQLRYRGLRPWPGGQRPSQCQAATMRGIRGRWVSLEASFWGLMACGSKVGANMSI